MDSIEAAIQLPPPQPWSFFLLSVLLTCLLAAAEVVAAFRDTTYSPWRCLFNGWSLPLFLFYGSLTLLLGVVLSENGVLPQTWTAAVALGLAGPALFRTRVKFFQPISGADGPAANLEKMTTGVQTFCFDQIKRQLARRRMSTRVELARQSEEALEERLRALVPPADFPRIEALIDERREEKPESVKAFLVALIEERDPAALDHPVSHPPEPPPP